MKKIFFIPLLFISLSLYSQTGDTGQDKSVKPNSFHQDSVAAKIQKIKDSVQKTLNDIQWENNMRNLEDVMRTVEKNKKKEKTKAILYIVIGVGLLLVLIFGLMRRRAERKV
jgi:hypothetical protein